jgi:membrane protein required for colicin V production
LNWLDIIIIIALIIPILAGLKIGLIKAALSLAGLIVGVVLASNFYQQLGGALGFITDEKIANIVGFIIILVVVMVIANVVAALIKYTAKAILLGWVDRLGGAVFGLFMGGLFMGAILATIVKFFGSGLVTESVLAGVLLDKFPIVLGLLPSEFSAVRDFFK